jgi:hypothetical protein
VTKDLLIDLPMPASVFIILQASTSGMLFNRCIMFDVDVVLLRPAACLGLWKNAKRRDLKKVDSTEGGMQTGPCNTAY